MFKIFIWELFYVLVANSDPWSHTTKMKLFLPLLSTTILLIKVTCDPIQQGQGNFKFSIGPPPPPTPEQEYLVRVYRSNKRRSTSKWSNQSFPKVIANKNQFLGRFDIWDFKQWRINNNSLKCLSLRKSIRPWIYKHLALEVCGHR